MDSKTLDAFVSPASGYVETKSKNPFALSANADNSEPSETKSVPPVKILAIESPVIISIKEPKEVIKSPIPSKGTVLKISKNGLTFSAKPAKFCPIVGKEFVIPSATPPTSEPTIVPICSNNLARVSAPESMNVVNPGICCKAPKAAINIVKPPKIVANPIIPDKNVAGLNAPIIAIAPVMRINDGLPKTVIALNNVVNNDAPLPKNAVNPGIVVNKPNASNNIVKPPKIIAISASPFINELGFIFDITEVNNVFDSWKDVVKRYPAQWVVFDKVDFDGARVNAGHIWVILPDEEIIDFKHKNRGKIVLPGLPDSPGCGRRCWQAFPRRLRNISFPQTRNAVCAAENW